MRVIVVDEDLTFIGKGFLDKEGKLCEIKGTLVEDPKGPYLHKDGKRYKADVELISAL